MFGVVGLGSRKLCELKAPRRTSRCRPRASRLLKMRTSFHDELEGEKKHTPWS